MNLEFKHLLPDSFSPNSRVWIYQSSRLFTMNEALQLEQLLQQFAAEWKSHGDSVDAYANLFFGQFIVLMADESRTTVGGCSTDSSQRFIKSLEQAFGVELFNRSNLAFFIKDKVQVLPMNQVTYALENGFLTPETPYFNNTVLTKKEMEESWIVPLKNSWLAKKFGLATA